MAEIGIRVVSNTNQAIADVRRLERQWDRVDDTVDQVNTSFNGLTRTLRGIAGVASAVFAAREVGQFARLLTEADSAAELLRARLQNLGVVGVTLEDLRASADRLGVATETAAESFARIALFRDELGLTDEQILSINENLLALGRIGGASVQELAGGLRQFTQALGSGRLQGEELRSVLENLPTVAQVIADEFEVSVGELRELGAQGLLVSDRIANAVLNAEGLEEQIANLPPNLQIAEARLGNAVGRLGDALDLTIRWAGALDTVASVVNTIAAGFDVIGSFVGQLGDPDDEIAQATAAADELLVAIEQIEAAIERQRLGGGVANQEDIDRLAELRERYAETTTEVEALTEAQDAAAESAQALQGPPEEFAGGPEFGPFDPAQARLDAAREERRRRADEDARRDAERQARIEAREQARLDRQIEREEQTLRRRAQTRAQAERDAQLELIEITGTFEEVQRARAEARELEQAERLAQGLITEEQFAEARVAINAQADQAIIENSESRVEEVTALLESTLGRSFNSLFDALREGEDAWEAFADTAINAIQRIAQEILISGIINLLTGQNFLTGGASPFAGLFGASGFGSAPLGGGGGAQAFAQAATTTTAGASGVFAPAGASGGPRGLAVTIRNEGTPQQVRQVNQQQGANPADLVVNIVTEDIGRRGPIARSLEGNFGLARS